MKYYIIAGEASGDLHGSNLIKELKRLDLFAAIQCWGGDLMEQAGAKVVKHYKELAFMGFTEVILNIRAIMGNFKFCKQDILSFQPDVLILIDYPGFNLRMAQWAKKHGFKVIFYISPQVWAWKENRVKAIKKYVDKMLVILPFEKEFYKKWDLEVEYVGHPLVEVIEEFKKMGSKPQVQNMSFQSKNIKSLIPKLKPLSLKPDLPIVALLPGSRKQEILEKLPVMLKTSELFPSYQFIVARAPGQEDSFYQELLKDYPAVSSVGDRTYELLSSASAACVTSGTATLETALFGVPEVVCYKSGYISYQIAKRLIRVKYISLVNLIMDKPVLRELIQDELIPRNLHTALNELLFDNQHIQELKSDYEHLRRILGEKGNASANAAKSIVKFLQS